MGVLEIVGWAVAIAVFVIVVAYLATRAASVAHYRTKLEYIRSIFREGAK